VSGYCYCACAWRRLVRVEQWEQFHLQPEEYNGGIRLQEQEYSPTQRNPEQDILESKRKLFFQKSIFFLFSKNRFFKILVFFNFTGNARHFSWYFKKKFNLKFNWTFWSWCGLYEIQNMQAGKGIQFNKPRFFRTVTAGWRYQCLQQIPDP